MKFVVIGLVKVVLSVNNVGIVSMQDKSLTQKQGEKKFVDHMMYLITSPVIYFPQWPPAEEMIKDRRIYLLADPKCFERKECSDYDALIYMHTVSMSVPLDQHWFNIFMHLFLKYYGKIAPAEWKKEYGGELDPHGKQELLRLKRWIFRQQTSLMKNKEKTNFKPS